jgi:tRNA pseudouridine13 synthase
VPVPRTLPFLTRGPVLRAVFKARWEDFEVVEIPARQPAGAGDHVWIEVEKRGLTTPRAAAELAAQLGVKPSTVGYAGMKDARAVARQWMSVEHVDPDHALSIEVPRLRVLRAARHPRKLRRGWHEGNRFRVLLRPLRETDSTGSNGDDDWAHRHLARVRDALGVLAAGGVPNYYGPQRFGTRGDTWEGIFADTGDILRARELFDEGRYDDAAGTWPRGFGQCARLARAMERTEGDAARALPVVGKRMLRLYGSAYQSWLFNAVLAERVRTGGVARLLAGDLAWKHDSEGLFKVVAPAVEQHRADAFEISPTGPLVGQRMKEPAGQAVTLENRILRAVGLRREELESRVMAPLTGRRRPLRFQLRDVGVAPGSDGLGPYLELCFRLPPGCYATAVLREVGKGGIEEGSSHPEHAADAHGRDV